MASGVREDRRAESSGERPTRDRKFVHLLVTADGPNCNHYTLHNINMASLYSDEDTDMDVDSDLAMEVARLPRTAMRLECPGTELAQFLLLGSRKIVAVHTNRRTLIYDVKSGAVRAGPMPHAPKLTSLSVAIGKATLYVLERYLNTERQPWFEVLRYSRRRNDWSWKALPPPPFVDAEAYRAPFFQSSVPFIVSYAVVGGTNIWMSAEGVGTYCFDTESAVWSKKADWVLPFRGGAEYVPEYKLWFGFAFSDDCFCTSNLTAASATRPPALQNIWNDLTPRKEWIPVGGESYHLAHLGGGRFCIARFFKTPCKRGQTEKYVGVFTAVEVERCERSVRGLRMVKRKSLCYKLGYSEMSCAL